MWPEIDLRQDRAFLVLAEELHFGRAAARLGVTHARVSQTIRTLEARVGATLFERTTRRVTLTRLGAELEGRLRPAHTELAAALERAATSVSGTAGTLRVGVTTVTDTLAVHELVDAIAIQHPDCRLTLVDIGIWDPYGPLRRGEIDVLCNWQVVDESDLTCGPTIAEHPRVLMVGAGHRLATKTAVTVEDLAGETVNGVPPSYPSALEDALHPPRTPSGLPIHRSPPIDSPAQVFNMVAHGELVSPAQARIRPWSARPGIVEIPFADLPPLPLGLIWCTAHENERIRTLAKFATASRDAADTVSDSRDWSHADITAVEGSELRALLTLADECHFARPAERLGLTPSRASQLIRKLETRIGAPLFDRTSRRVQLTPVGSQLCQELRPAYDEIANAINLARRTSRTVGQPAPTNRPHSFGHPVQNTGIVFQS
jgi:DNA-binding transcriptional LysR family regulator